MTLTVQIFGRPDEIHDVEELHVYFDRNIYTLVYKNEQDAINTFELSSVGFPNNAITLLVQDA